MNSKTIKFLVLLLVFIFVAASFMLASGEQLPDLLHTIEYSSVQFQELKEGNAIYKLNELIDPYCPLMWPLLDP